MITVRQAITSNLQQAMTLEAHIDSSALLEKIGRQELIIAEDTAGIVGLLRFSLFWDQIPFMNLLKVKVDYQRQGIGTALVTEWERQMRSLGHRLLLTSTQADEQAQHFYRKLGYADIGGFVLPGDPLEVILLKQFK